MSQPTEQEKRSALLRRIQNDFVYHKPHGNQVERYATIRDSCKATAEVMVRLCPPSRELSSALTKLEEASMHANAAIARNEKEAPEEEAAR